MSDRVKAVIQTRYAEMPDEVFNQWLLEYLTKDINDLDRDNTRLEILRFVAEEGLI